MCRRQNRLLDKLLIIFIHDPPQNLLQIVLHGCVAWHVGIMSSSKRVRNPTKSIGLTSMTHQQAVHLNRRTQFCLVRYGSGWELNVQNIRLFYTFDVVSNAVCLYLRYYLNMSLQKKITTHFEFYQQIFYTLATIWFIFTKFFIRKCKIFHTIKQINKCLNQKYFFIR